MKKIVLAAVFIFLLGSLVAESQVVDFADANSDVSFSDHFDGNIIDSTKG